MHSIPRSGLIFTLLLSLVPASQAGQISQDISAKIDALVASTYLAASAKLPCKVSAPLRQRMLRWQDVDKCMDQAQSRVDWDTLVAELQSIRPAQVAEGDFAAAVEESFAKQALPFNKVFQVKNKEALLPLTNSILKYLPPGALTDQPVFDQKGKQQLGTFVAVFYYERAGGLASANPYRLALFQYKDLQGKLQPPSNQLLLDTYGVPYAGIQDQPGFRLTHKKLQEIGIK